MRPAGLVLVVTLAGLASASDEPNTGLVRVLVVDADGRLVKHAHAEVVSARRWSLEDIRAALAFGLRWDEDGARVVMARSGPARAVAYAGGHGVGVSPWFEVEPGKTTDAGVVRLERLDPGLRIDGVVTWDGRPVKWSRVRH